MMSSLTPRIDSLLAGRNAVINGDFEIWQRATTFTAPASGAYLADRYFISYVGTMVQDVTRQADVPTLAESGHQSNYSMRVQITTADASIAAGDFLLIRQSIEGYNYKPLHGRAARLQFWVKSNKPGSYGVALHNNGSSRNYAASYSINASNVWEKKTIDLFLDTAGTWLFDNGQGLNLSWYLTAGTNRSTSSINQWTNAANSSTVSGNTNFADTIGNTWQIAQVQIVPVGESLLDSASDVPFYDRHMAEEIVLCQRYYEKSYNIDVNPGTNTATGTWAAAARATSATATDAATIKYSVPKRTAPSVTTYTAAGTSGQVSANGSGTSPVASVIGGGGYGSFFVSIAAGSAMTVGQAIQLSGHWTADAEI